MDLFDKCPDLSVRPMELKLKDLVERLDAGGEPAARLRPFETFIRGVDEHLLRRFFISPEQAEHINRIHREMF